MDDRDEERGITYDGDEFFDLGGSGSDDDGRIVMPTTGQATLTLGRDSVLHISIPKRRRRPLEIVLERGSGSRDQTIPEAAEIGVDRRDHTVPEHEPPSSSSDSSDSDPWGVDDDKVWSLLPRPAPAIRSEAKIDLAQQSKVRPVENAEEAEGEDEEEEVYDALEAEEVAAEPSSKVVGFAAQSEDDDENVQEVATSPAADGDTVKNESSKLVRFAAAAATETLVSDDDEDEFQEASTRALRFAAIEKPLATSAKRAVRFHAPEFDESEEDDDEEKVQVKLVRFADAAATPKKKKSVRFARGTSGGSSPSKAKVRFDDDDGPGEKKKASLESPKVVRFLLPTIDAVSGKPRMRIFLPGVQRVRRNTIKHSSVRVYPDPPLWLVLRLMETERFRHFSGRGRGKACHVLGVAGTILSALALLVCMVLLALYFHLRPRIPHLRIDEFDVSVMYELLDEDTLLMQQVEDRGNYYFYKGIVYGMFMVSYRNLNSAVDFYNYYVESSVFYQGHFMGKSLVHNFMVPRKSTMPLQFVIYNELLVPLQVGYTMLKQIATLRVDYVCEFIIKARMSTLGSIITSRFFWHRVRCSIEMTDEKIDRLCRDYNY